MRSSLMDADDAEANSEMHKDWVTNRVRNIAYELEDTIDEFTFQRKEEVPMKVCVEQNFGRRSTSPFRKSLGEDEAWELSGKRAFPSDLGGCPSYLDSLARNLVERCEGLPKAIVALGSSMSSKKSIAEWKRT
ncbi:NB-ARC - like 10 [Theobroma cacao]|nr:NB-ARC - like 10 [Theobroma cacao]WRX35042.1 NB-ARC - like 10 [Theobroma cacao]